MNNIASPTYNITITQITVGGTTADLEFHAIFDTGTSFTYLNDPAYTQITESVSGLCIIFLSTISSFKKCQLKILVLLIFQFNSLAKEDRHANSDIPFEYCYDLRSVIAKR